MEKKFLKYIFRNHLFDKKELQSLMLWVFNNYGATKASLLGDFLKTLGFAYATKAGLSISIEDLKIPPGKKSLIREANLEVTEIKAKTKRGELTIIENFQAVITKWNETSEFLKESLLAYFKTYDPLNSVYIMAFSGARGNVSQVRQLVGMRGLMSDPSGRIIPQPIKKNFREGLSVTDYIVSSYGARKGLVDTALKTADSGYLTRRLVDVVQDIMIRESDCETERSLQVQENLNENLLGRILAKNLKATLTNKVIAIKGEVISINLLERYKETNIKEICIRSPLICESDRSICQKCYGWNLAYSCLVDIGEAIGIIAAQSIGEPGTQLTMRTFHTGGIFTAEIGRQVRSSFTGELFYSKTLKTKLIRTPDGFLAERVTGAGYLVLRKLKTDYQHKVYLNLGVHLFTEQQTTVTQNQLLIRIPKKRTYTKQGGKIKPLYVPISGEIFRENFYLHTLKNQKGHLKKKEQLKQDHMMWLIYGQVYLIPNCFELLTQKTSRFYKNKSLAQSKIITRTEGFIDFWQSDLYQKIKNLAIVTKYTFSKKIHYKLIRDSKIVQSFLFVGKEVFVGLKQSRHFTDLFKTQGLHKKNFKTFATGSFFNLLKNKNLNTTILWLPEEIKTFNLRHYVVQKQFNKFFYPKKNSTSKTNFMLPGSLFPGKRTNFTIDITLWPGKQFELKSFKGIEIYENRIYFPGEIIANQIIITELSFVKILDHPLNLNTINILVCSIYQFKLPFSNFSNYKNKINKLWKTKINISTLFTLNSKDSKKEKEDCNILSSQLKCSSKYHFLGYRAAIIENKFKFLISPKSQEVLGLKNQFLIPSNIYNPKELIKKHTSSQILLTKKQYVEPYTVITFYGLLAKRNLEVKYLRNLISEYRKILIVRREDQKIYHARFKQNNSNKVYLKPFIRYGENIHRHNKCQFSAKIDFVTKRTISYQIGHPLLFLSGDVSYIQHGDFIEKGKSIGLFHCTVQKASDIVQGLPKVEEILEARKPSLVRNLYKIPNDQKEREISDAEKKSVYSENSAVNPNFHKIKVKTPIIPGIFIGGKYIIKELNNTKVSNYKFELEFLTRYKNRPVIYWFPLIYPKKYGELNKLYKFKNISNSFVPVKRNPHIILNSLFMYYSHCDFLSLIDAIHRSCIKLQILLIELIQEVYQSQGVYISSKHLELIVKQMTSKVKIVQGNDSGLLPGEEVGLKQIELIERSILNLSNDPPKYYPILMGITRVSLKTDSFISAASFQETGRVLTKAAIEGQIDWLYGLKENVILGRLIPVGTGFNNYVDLSHEVIGIADLERTFEKMIYNNSMSLPNELIPS